MANSFASYYELFSKITQVQRTRCVEYFYGSALPPIWTRSDIAGTGSTAQNDASTGGLQVTSGATSGNETLIGFNNKRIFDNTSSKLIVVFKALSNTSAVAYSGFVNDGTLTYTNVNDRALIVNDSANANYSLRTADSSTNSEDTTSGVAKDTSFHTHEIILTVSNCTLYIDGVLKITKSSNLPTVKLQPVVGTKTTTSAGKTAEVTYLEAFNV